MSTVTHAASGVAFEAPSGWLPILEDDPAMLVVAAPADPPRFRANLVLVVEPLLGIDYATWQNGADEELPVRLADYFLIDLERCWVAGHDGGRRLAHHVDPEGRSVVMEQWFLEVAGTGVTLTATSGVHDYDSLADTLGEVAATLRVPDHVAGGS